MPDTRTSKRFPLKLATTIKGKKAKLKGTTADLSAAGVFILADAEFEVGSDVEFDIVLPSAMIGAKNDVEVRCKGRVIRKGASSKARSKKKGSKDGVACVIDSYKFIRKKK